MLVFKVNEQYLKEVLNNYMTNTRQNVSLYGSDGREIYTYMPFEINYGTPLNELAGTQNGTSAREIKAGNDTIYLLHETIMPDNWKLIMAPN